MKTIAELAETSINTIWDNLDSTHEKLVENRRKRTQTNITGEKLIAEAIHDLTDMIVMITLAQSGVATWERALAKAKDRSDQVPIISGPPESPPAEEDAANRVAYEQSNQGLTSA